MPLVSFRDTALETLDVADFNDVGVAVISHEHEKSPPSPSPSPAILRRGSNESLYQRSSRNNSNDESGRVVIQGGAGRGGILPSSPLAQEFELQKSPNNFFKEVVGVNRCDPHGHCGSKNNVVYLPCAVFESSPQTNQSNHKYHTPQRLDYHHYPSTASHPLLNIEEVSELTIDTALRHSESTNEKSPPTLTKPSHQLTPLQTNLSPSENDSDHSNRGERCFPFDKDHDLSGKGEDSGRLSKSTKSHSEKPQSSPLLSPPSSDQWPWKNHQTSLPSKSAVAPPTTTTHPQSETQKQQEQEQEQKQQQSSISSNNTTATVTNISPYILHLEQQVKRLTVELAQSRSENDVQALELRNMTRDRDDWKSKWETCKKKVDEMERKLVRNVMNATKSGGVSVSEGEDEKSRRRRRNKRREARRLLLEEDEDYDLDSHHASNAASSAVVVEVQPAKKPNKDEENLSSSSNRRFSFNQPSYIPVGWNEDSEDDFSSSDDDDDDDFDFDYDSDDLRKRREGRQLQKEKGQRRRQKKEVNNGFKDHDNEHSHKEEGIINGKNDKDKQIEQENQQEPSCKGDVLPDCGKVVTDDEDDENNNDDSNNLNFKGDLTCHNCCAKSTEKDDDHNDKIDDLPDDDPFATMREYSQEEQKHRKGNDNSASGKGGYMNGSVRGVGWLNNVFKRDNSQSELRHV